MFRHLHPKVGGVSGWAESAGGAPGVHQPQPSPGSVLRPLQLVRPGMQLPARMPRASLNPSIPAPNAAASATSAVAVGPPMAQQVNAAHLFLMDEPGYWRLTVTPSNGRCSSSIP